MPVDSIATVSPPHCSNQSARRCRSVVKVPKVRTGSGSQPGRTAATCRVAPMSTAAAWGCHGDGPGQCPAPGGSASVASWQAPPLDQGGGAGLRERINFRTGIALASPLSSPQQPVGQVWYRGLAHQKPDGRSPPRLIIAPAVPPATGGTNSATVWEKPVLHRERASPDL